jgi:hypothetical protein
MDATICAARIGGVAVAVGIGVAIASAQGTAQADTGSSSSAAHSSDKASSAHQPGTSKAATAKSGGAKALAVRVKTTPVKAVTTKSTAAPRFSTDSSTDDAAPVKATAPADVVVTPAAHAQITAATPTPSTGDPGPRELLVTVLTWARKGLDDVTAALGPEVQALPIVREANAALTGWIGDLTRSTAYSPTTPSPTDVVSTPYGDIGKWMLQSDGEISDWLGQKYGSRNLLEPINVIIVDTTSTTAEESTQKMIAAMTAAGFPAQTVHSTGYQGLIDGVTYSQEPTGAEEAFSDCFYLLPNDHGRVFGAAALPDGSTGFVWAAALSREEVGLYDGSFTHRYVSFDQARDTLRNRLVGQGATDLGVIAMNNAVDSATQFTGDNDGYAVVVQLA